MTETLKLAVVTDIHHGPDRYTKKGAAALPLLRAFSDRVAAGAFDLVVDLGDRISNVDRDTDLQFMAEVASVFEEIGIPREHLLGNHDLHYISAGENEAIMGRSLGSHSIDLKGQHLVFWQHDLSGSFSEEPVPSSSDLEWLRADLESTNLPAIIFTHVPLNDAAMTGNFYFQNNAASATLRQTAQAREVIEAAGNVVLCVAGHVHWNDCTTIDGVRYLTLQSLTESYTTQNEASAAWAEIEVDGQVRWRAHGGDPMVFEAPLRGRNMRWVPPLPAFQVLRQQELADRINDPVHGVILDMDGVLFRGEQSIEGSAEAVRDLQAHGIGIVCLTNNARRTPEDYEKKLRKLGILVNATNILTSGLAVARFLTTQDSAPKVHVVGSDVLRHTLLDAGAVESENPDYVVASIDLDLKIADLTPAIRHLSNGAKLIASNADAVIPTPNGPEPEAGPVAAFLEAASGQTAIMLGKPQSAIFELALERLGLASEAVVMVGDTPSTDIAGATASGLRSILVASGNTASDTASEHEPTARFPDLRAAVDFLVKQSA
ncbi:MAG: HAD-IIA family hydrolase [Alphaproteobacteria bacterium]|nr:HAD-IIA family hydrolase [Alphaproteobacteria bacterium]